MAKDRIVSGTTRTSEDESANYALRPRTLGEYVGQRDLVEKLAIAIQAARQRHEPMEHVLLHGPPGLGKTSLAHVIAAEMGTHVYVASGPALTKGSDLVGMLTKMQAHDVLFIDEIHRLPAAVEEYIYPAMEDYRIDITVDSGMHAKVLTLRLKPFTLIGATTRAGLLSGALRSRFGITHNLRFYDEHDLAAILTRSAAMLQLGTLDDSTIQAIARRSRGTPRVTNRLLRRVRDFAQVRARGRITPQAVADALALEGVDELGLDELDRVYLRTVLTTYRGGPVGVEAIAATMGEDAGTLEDVVEPYLLQVGFLARTRQGRRLTPTAADYLGLPLPTPLVETTVGLFDAAPSDVAG
jgi:holliday junction DNA helicase RuvB